MKKCIIGKNSNLIQNIISDLSEFDLFSHKDILDINFEKYSHVYLFSWSHSSQKENFKLIEIIPSEKLIFISSVAVYANAIRTQWNKYPRTKLEIEKLVLSKGGSIVRFGVCDENLLLKHTGLIPFTSAKSILDFLNSESPSKITNLFSLTDGLLNPNSFLAKFSTLLNTILDFLPSKIIFQAPLELLIKLSGSPNYGYTNNCQRFFGSSLQIGYGVLGSNYWKLNMSIKRDILLVSPKNDKFLNDNGFRGLRIGKKYTGLSKFWHGVSIVSDQGFNKKNVPLLVKRPKLPKNALLGEAKNFKFSNGVFRVLIECPIDHLEIMCPNLVLAAGAIENCKIINASSKKDISLTDHEIGFIGTVDCKEIVEKKYLKKLGFLLIGRRVFSYDKNQVFMLDFRPLSIKTINSKENVYNDSASGILTKIIRRLTFGQINEAFFNKFGVGISTKKLAVFMQLEIKDCISLFPNGNLERKRAKPDLLTKVIKKVKEEFMSFSSIDNLFLFDGIHVFGGKELLEDKMIKDLLNSNKLKILGSPIDAELGPFHQTQRHINSIQGTGNT